MSCVWKYGSTPSWVVALVYDSVVCMRWTNLTNRET